MLNAMLNPILGGGNLPSALPGYLAVAFGSNETELEDENMNSPVSNRRAGVRRRA